MAGQHKLNKVKATSVEWAKVVDQSNVALQKAKLMYANTSKGQFVESRIHRKELVHYGLVEAGADDDPMSPLAYPDPSTYGFGKSKKVPGKKNPTKSIQHNMMMSMNSTMSAAPESDGGSSNGPNRDT